MRTGEEVTEPLSEEKDRKLETRVGVEEERARLSVWILSACEEWWSLSSEESITGHDRSFFVRRE